MSLTSLVSTDPNVSGALRKLLKPEDAQYVKARAEATIWQQQKRVDVEYLICKEYAKNSGGKSMTPNRVVINKEGEAIPAWSAENKGIVLAIVFIREDGWSLGAPKDLESVAYHTWEGDWESFIRDGVKQPIAAYQEKKQP